MERMEQLKTITYELRECVSESFSTNDREKKMDEMNQLLEKRAHILESIEPPYTEEEQAIGKELLPIDAEITEKMNAIFSNIKQEIRSVKKQKTLNKQYTNPYINVVTNDGTYWDKKK
ncbi:flagellar protein FliT [Natronobacillus azotifigens]|uniref:Flagellar protein FliT n=1 Tax=Natronobacillus azotifigens TaxID=472978 RepID=A0A9J6REG3_9BACI|nr:flagellar protein FliT [Natronobacillus azotifigens]MCZ0704138.1 flagellar protein FliT [Natronobacillus azotifigens]